MKTTCLVIFLLLAFCVGNVSAGLGSQEPREVPLSSLSFIFDSGYLIDEALSFYPGYHPFNFDSDDYPGAVVLVGSREAVLLLSDFAEEAPSDIMASVLMTRAFCLAQRSVVIAYGEGYPYRVTMVSIRMDKELLRFSSEMVKKIQEQPICE